MFTIMGRHKKNKTRLSSLTPFVFKLGQFKALNVRLTEIAINNVVLRVPLCHPKEKRKRGRPPKKGNRLLLSVNKKTAKDETKSNENDGDKFESNHSPSKLSLSKEDATSTLELKVPLISYSKLKVERKRGRPPRVKRQLLTKQNSESGQDTIEKTPSNAEDANNLLTKQHSTCLNPLIRLIPLQFERKNELKKEDLVLKPHNKDDQPTKSEAKLCCTDMKIAPSCCGHSILTVDFKKLSKLVRVIKLPSPMWKIMLVMNSDLTTVYKFVNNNSIKCVSFSQINPDCNIVMQGVPVILLGCPKTIDDIQDIEILLEIVDRIDRGDCMVSELKS